MKKSTQLYPLRFHPILKSKIWGGNKLKTQLNKPSEDDDLGESWEISDVKGDVSVVAEGELQGENLKDIIQTYQDELVGKSVYAQFNDEFPLLIKFIDAADTLSVQLHPDDQLAKKRHNSFGKTEMWYVVDHDEDAFIIADFKDKINPTILEDYIDKGILQNHLKAYQVEQGDSFFISPGLVHAIGKGVLLAEIQQTSDITYRLYDWDRKDQQGNSRQLHIEESKEALDYSLAAQPKIKYDKAEKASLLADNKYFTTNRIQLATSRILNLTDRDSFTILMNVDGEAQVKYQQKKYSLNKGETLLIPACFNQIELLPKGKCILLDICIS